MAVSYALTSMEFALAHEAFHVGSTMREAGIVFDPLTFVALRILEASASESRTRPACSVRSPTTGRSTRVKWSWRRTGSPKKRPEPGQRVREALDGCEQVLALALRLCDVAGGDRLGDAVAHVVLRAA